MPNSLSELHTLHAWEDNQITERCTQGEYAGKVLQFKLVDKDGAINLSNCLVQYAVTRPDKTEDLLDCTVDNGVVKCNLTYSATSISGLVHGEVRVIGSNNSGTIKFYGVNLRVYKGVSDEAAEQSDEFTALIAALQKVATVNPDGSNTVTLDSAIVENGTNPVASGVIYAALQVLDNAKIDKDKAVKYTGSNDLSECVDNGVLYRVHDGTTYQILLCNSGDAYRVQYMFKRSGEVVFRTSAKSNDTWGAWSAWSPIGTTSNIADGAVTTAKIADDLAAVINAKEEKSNKKTTLTGNESSNDYYPTTKAVADALNTKVKYMILGENDDLPQEGDEKTDYYKLENNNYIHYRWIDNDYEIISGNSYSKIESDNRYTKTSSGNVPTTSTVGNPGDIIKANDALYECFGTNGTYYIWKKVSFGGGAAFTSEIALRNAIIAGDVTAGMSISLLENGKYKNYIIQTVNTTTGAYTKTQSGGGEVVTDVIYSDEDLSEYSSVNSTLNSNQACVVIAPNEVDPYFLKSAQVKTKAGTPVKFSVFGISNVQDGSNRKRFTKVRDIAVINADDDGVARIEFNLPMRLIPDETVLVASCDTSQSSFFYGLYKDAQHTIFNTTKSSWFDLQPGESVSSPFGYYTSGHSPYFVLEYVLVSNATEIKKSAAEILQEQEYFPYDNFVSDTSMNAVQNKVIYPFIISKDENVVNDKETTYLSAGKYNVDEMAYFFAISCEAPTYGTYSVSSIEVRAENDAVITFGLWEMRFYGADIKQGRGYWNLKQVLGTVTAANTRAKLTFQTPIVVDSSNQVIIATCPRKKIAYRSAATSPNPWKYTRVANSVFWRNDNSFSNAQVGDEVNLLSWIGGYNGWDYRENNPHTGAYEITYTPTVPEILTETRTLETCVNELSSPIGSLRNKVWYCAGDSTTYGMEGGRSYAQIIAERNGMELWKDGIGGTVMTSYPDTNLVRAFSFDRYLNIPENVDFVTLWFGINDSRRGYPVGELDSDNPATFCGAYNKVLTWIINNRPNARVGLVVTHGAGDSFKNAIRNLAKKYGFLVFDWQTDPRIPFWHPTDSYYANDVDEAVKTLRKSQWWADPLHPLTAGYEAISYPFESWLRSL